ncbi:MAG: endonuclease MutS2 [Deltaproteobacteria bacterium]|nr:endonuclease MutS2 [Deltaproteobacteria bacterium]
MPVNTSASPESQVLSKIPPKTLDDLGWPKLIEHLAARCHTERGSAAAGALELFEHPEEARRRHAEIAEARLLHELGEPMPFGGIEDVVAWLDRVQKGGILEGPELLSVARTVDGHARLRRHVVARRGQAPLLSALAEEILELAHVSGPILDSFEEGGRLADHASPALGPLRRRVGQLNDELSRRVRGLLDHPAISPHLQDRFYTQRDNRYVVPLRAEARSRVKGIVHGTSQSGHTVFVEPEEIVDLNNRLALAESEVAEEENRILAELTGYVREEIPAIRAAIDAATHLDLVDGAARLADAQSASAPEIDDSGLLDLGQARHPLMVLAGRHCVPNDIRLAPRTTLIVSGPNAGGKTVVLKTAGLVALMARAGLHVPARPGSRVPFYRVIHTDIGDDQSLERNLSTFTAHVLHLCEFLSDASDRALILIDEVAVGTDPEQGAALAQAVLEALASGGAQAIVTTHYERLKALPPRDPRFESASVGFDLERMTPTFHLHLGVPGSSSALLVARRHGMPAPVAVRAEELLGDRRAGLEELLTALAEERRKIHDERAQIEAMRREAETARQEAETMKRAAQARERELRRGAHVEAVSALRRARDELDRLRASLKQAASLEEAAAAKEKIASLADEVAARAPEPETAGAPASAEDLVVGTAVLVPSLGGRGFVTAPPERGRVTVQIGKMKTAVDVQKLRLDPTPTPSRHERRAKEAQVKRQAISRTSHAQAMMQAQDELAPARTADATLDLRGTRVDEALAEVDRFLDDALLRSREVVFLIHGHGTGALKSAVRSHLGSHAAVARWRAGTAKEGGDGVTVTWLDVV